MPSYESGDWDVLSGPGLTALGLAASRLVETERPDRLIDDPYGEAFLAAVDSPVPFPTTWPTDDSDVPDQQALHLHGSRYIGLRTRIYDDAILDAVSAGVRQVVLLAAGLDTRAVRLRWPPGVTLLEVDQPQVLAFKDDVLRQAGIQPGCERIAVGVDLRDDWTGPLAGAGLRPEQPTAWVAEGLLAYLPPEAEHTLFERIRGLSAEGSRLAVDRLLSNEKDALDRLSRRSGLDMNSMIDTSARPDPADLLRDLGWSVDEVDVGTLADRYQRDLSDPFARTGAGAPPWLATGFVFARLSGDAHPNSRS